MEMQSLAEREAARERGIRNVLREYFDPHITDSNRAAFDALIDDRTREFLDMPGESEQTIREVFSKAETMDWVAVLGRGFFGTTGFGGSGRVLDAKPAIAETIGSGLKHLPGFGNAPSNFNDNFAAGWIQGASDHVWGRALERSMGGIRWLEANSEDLEGPMQLAKEAVKPTLKKSLGEHVLAIEFPFRARDVATSAFALAGASAETVSWASFAGALAAGAGYSGLQHLYEKREHRTGPAYLLGQRDWKPQYERLKAATWTDAVGNGVGRLTQGAVDLAGAAPRVPHTVTEVKAYTRGGALALGSAVSNVLSDAASGAVQSQLGATAASHAVSFGVGAFTSAAWATATVATTPAANAVRDLWDRAGDSAGRFTAQQARAGAHRASRLVTGALHEMGRATHAVGMSVRRRIDAPTNRPADVAGPPVDSNDADNAV
ncbi:MAG: hypothetical protein ACTHKH_19435 [Trinickia sp.]